MPDPVRDRRVLVTGLPQEDLHILDVCAPATATEHPAQVSIDTPLGASPKASTSTAATSYSAAT